MESPSYDAGVNNKFSVTGLESGTEYAVNVVAICDAKCAGKNY